jgi:hypothetical protein
MDRGPLVKEEIDAAAELIREFDKYAPVKVAFWLRASDEPYRYLYLVSDRIGDADVRDAYAEVVRIGNQITSPDFNLFRTKIVTADDPLAKAAAGIQARYPHQLGRRFGSTPFGDVFADDVYIYPTPLPAAVS